MLWLCLRVPAIHPEATRNRSRQHLRESSDFNRHTHMHARTRKHTHAHASTHTHTTPSHAIDVPPIQRRVVRSVDEELRPAGVWAVVVCHCQRSNFVWYLFRVLIVNASRAVPLAPSRYFSACICSPVSCNKRCIAGIFARVSIRSDSRLQSTRGRCGRLTTSGWEPR